MIKLSFTGGATIHSISAVQEIPSKNGGAPFQKRELVIDDSWTDRDGTPRLNYVSIEFTGDKMALLDKFKPGERVNLDTCVNGREFNGRIFMSVRGLGITPYQEQPQQPQQGYQQQPQQPTYPQQPQQGYVPQQPAYPQAAPQTAYPQQPAYQQPAYQQPAYPQQPPSGAPF